MNAWVVHRDQNVFGTDADIFRPERWLGPREEVLVMDRNLFSVLHSIFGDKRINANIFLVWCRLSNLHRKEHQFTRNYETHP